LKAVSPADGSAKALAGGCSYLAKVLHLSDTWCESDTEGDTKQVYNS